MEKIVKFKGLCCAACANKLEKKLNKIKGVKVELSFVASKMLIEYENEELLNEIVKVAKEVEPEMEILL
jgi:copper chaperone CopZ